MDRNDAPDIALKKNATVESESFTTSSSSLWNFSTLNRENLGRLKTSATGELVSVAFGIMSLPSSIWSCQARGTLQFFKSIRQSLPQGMISTSEDRLFHYAMVWSAAWRYLHLLRCSSHFWGPPWFEPDFILAFDTISNRGNTQIVDFLYWAILGEIARCGYRPCLKFDLVMSLTLMHWNLHIDDSCASKALFGGGGVAYAVTILGFSYSNFEGLDSLPFSFYCFRPTLFFPFYFFNTHSLVMRLLLMVFTNTAPPFMKKFLDLIF